MSQEIFQKEKIRKERILRVTKSFEIKPSYEANFITEAFGIDAGYINNIVDMEFPDNYKLIYITGESGSGKSTILNEVFPNYKHEDIPDKPLFQWGSNESKTLEFLSLVGLGDATLFLSKYSQLSDSQKARARIFLELMSDKDTIVIDEFLSTLDRLTAKSVAYCFSKALIKVSKKAVVCTAHNDLKEFLKPCYIVEGNAFPSRWLVSKYIPEIENPIIKDVQFEYRDKLFYKKLRLGELHYKGKYTGGVKEYLSAELNGECIGVLVSTYRMHDGGRRISRVVVHPSYRGVGLGVAIIKRYLRDFPNADVIATMASFNPVFEKAGMIRVKDSEVKPPSGLSKDLKSKGFDVSKWFSRCYCLEFMDNHLNKEILLKYTDKIGYLICPAGRYLSEEELAEKVIQDNSTAGRVLWNLRPKKMAKFVGEGLAE